jgi:hypothetical protein
MQPTAPVFQPAGDSRNNAIALSSFLDLFAASSLPSQQGEKQELDNDLSPVGNAGSPALSRAAGDMAVANLQAQKVTAMPGTEQGPVVPVAAGQSKELPTALPSESRTESAQQRGGVQNELTVIPKAGGWRSLWRSKHKRRV